MLYFQLKETPNLVSPHKNTKGAGTCQGYADSYHWSGGCLALTGR
jgi:hypothetical protein